MNIKSSNLRLFLGLIFLSALFILSAQMIMGKDGWICDDKTKMWVKHGNPSALAPMEGCGVPITTPVALNFTKSGNLSANKDTSWSLVYEEPGKPALKANLIFVSKSVCKKGPNTIEVLCSALQGIGENGDRVLIEGDMNGTNIWVSRLTMED